jgi:UDP-2-acetamido-3-amino-2,3-dideoxy-glucuronate N-acetyltransferase
MSKPDSFYAHPSAVLDDGCEIGARTKIWHFCHVMPEAVIGTDCVLGQNVFVAGKVRLGNNVKVQNNVSLFEGVICEDNTFLGPSMVFTNVINPRSSVKRKDEYMKTLVKEGASIGANVTLICGNTVGAYSFIGAGAVITKDVPDYALMVGNPARQVGWMSKAGLRLHFNEQNIAVCPETKEKYELKDDTVRLLN